MSWPQWVIQLIIAVVASAVSYLTRPDSDFDLDSLTGTHDVKANTRGINQYLRIVYGENRVGGNDVFIESTGTDNEYLWLVQTLCEGPIEGITTDSGYYDIYIDDVVLNDFDGYPSDIAVWPYTGTSSQTYNLQLNAVKGAWVDNMRYTAYIVYKLTYNTDIYSHLPIRTSKIKGLLLYDFRTTSTAYSTNGVLALYDYMTNTRYGMGFNSSQFDITSWTAAANYIDSKGWAFNMVFTENDTSLDIIETILTHIRCQLLEYNGYFYLKYLDMNLESSVMTLTEDDIMRDDDGKSTITVSEPTRFNKPDGAKIQYIDASKGYNPDMIYIGDVNGQIRQIDLLGCTDRDTAMELGFFYLEREKLNRVVSGTFHERCVVLEPHDVITLSCTWMGLNSQEMRVVSAAIRPDGTVDLQLIYESDDLYNTTYDANIDSAYVCNVPDPMTESQSVTNVSVTWDGADGSTAYLGRLHITYDPPTTGTWEYSRIYLSTDGGSTWVYWGTDTSGDFYIDGLGTYWDYGDTVDVLITSVNTAGVEETTSSSDGNAAITTPISFSDFYANDRALWGGHADITNGAVTVVIDSSVPKIALGGGSYSADYMDLTNTATHPGFYVQGTDGSFRFGLASKYGVCDVTAGTFVFHGIKLESDVEINLSGTEADSWTINSDDEDVTVSLIFANGVDGDATIAWDGTSVTLDQSLTFTGGTYDVVIENSGNDFDITGGDPLNDMTISGFGDIVITSQDYTSIVADDGTWYSEIGVDNGLANAVAWLYNYHATYGNQALTLRLSATVSEFIPEYGTIDLGSATYPFENFYLDGVITQGGHATYDIVYENNASYAGIFPPSDGVYEFYVGSAYHSRRWQYVSMDSKEDSRLVCWYDGNYNASIVASSDGSTWSSINFITEFNAVASQVGLDAALGAFTPQSSTTVDLGETNNPWEDFYLDGTITQGGGTYDITIANSAATYDIDPDTPDVVTVRWGYTNQFRRFYVEAYDDASIWTQTNAVAGSHRYAGVQTINNGTYNGVYLMAADSDGADTYFEVALEVIDDVGSFAPYDDDGVGIPLGTASKPWSDFFLDGIITHGGGTYDVTYTNSGTDYIIAPDTDSAVTLQTYTGAHAVMFDYIDINADELSLGSFYDTNNQAYIYMGAYGSESDVYIQSRYGGTSYQMTLWAGAAGGALICDNSNIDLGYSTGAWNRLWLKSGGNITTPSGNLEIDPAGDLVLDPGNDDVYPGAHDINLGTITEKWLTIHARELWVSTLVAESVISTIGGHIITAPTTTLAEDITTDTTFDVVDASAFAVNDFIMLQTAPGGVAQFEVMQITGISTNTITVTRNVDGSGINSWNDGDAVVNIGYATGDGWLEQYSLSSLRDEDTGTTTGPTIVGWVRTGTSWENFVEGWAIGNLNGLYGKGSVMGVGLGEYQTSSYIVITNTDGIEFYDASDNLRAQLDDSVWTLGDTGNEHIEITATGVSIKNSSNTIASLIDSVLTLGLSGAEHAVIDTNGVSLYDNTSMYARFAATTTIGLTSAEHINITSSSVQFKDGATGYVYTDLTAGVLTLGYTSDAYITLSSTALTMYDSSGADRVVLSSSVLTLGDTDDGEYVTLDNTNGLRMYSNSLLYTQLTTAGALYLGRQGYDYINIGPTNGIRMYSNTGTLYAQLSTAGILYLGDQSGEHLRVTSAGSYAYNGSTKLAQFTSAGAALYDGNGDLRVNVYNTGITLGLASSHHSTYTSSAITLWDSDGTTERVIISAAGSITLYDSGGDDRLVLSTTGIVVGQETTGNFVEVTDTGVDVYGITTSGLKNELVNGDFNDWTAGTSSNPDYWTTSGTGRTIAQDASDPVVGSYSLKLTRSGAATYLSQANIHLDKGIAYWQGRTVTAGAWVKTSVSSGTVRIYINDGTQTYSDWHTGGGAWEFLTVTKTISGSATTLGMHSLISADGDVYYDGFIMVEGTSLPPFMDSNLGTIDDWHSRLVNSGLAIYDGTTLRALYGAAISLYDASGDERINLSTSGLLIGRTGSTYRNVYITDSVIQMRLNTTPYFEVNSSGTVIIGDDSAGDYITLATTGINLYGNSALRMHFDTDGSGYIGPDNTNFYWDTDGVPYFNLYQLFGVVAGDDAVVEANTRRDTTSVTPLLRKSFQIGITGEYRIKWRHGAWDNTYDNVYYSYTRVYVNDTPVGTQRNFYAPYSAVSTPTFNSPDPYEDLNLEAGDIVDIYAWVQTGTVTCTVDDASVCVDSVPFNTAVITD